MKTKVFITAIAIALGNLVVSTSASAQYVIKGISCAKTNYSDAHEVYVNRTGVTRYVTVQIVRDGCRPKGDGGFLGVQKTFPSGASQSLYSMERQGKRTSAVGESLPNGYRLKLYFADVVGARESGTFDYIFSVD